MAQQVLELIRGNSSDIFKLNIKKYVMDSTWTCKLTVVKKFGDVKLIDKSADFNATDIVFNTLITPAESALLTEGDYILTFSFENISQLFKREVQYKLRVLPSGSM